ncbi:hypothetical protein M404DRAFT_26465 [Pisolithus tinctorius Marx 270]|uniref:Uncharacterized protein n=1 Tax=Pisolithus tinctorius Marx 270 TaxID=870435 RepID=A0A0C3NTR8_PISTI|nr:hypothetical protein M404DRAFT_26465 [Pisolithus tinctorius Marx 270]
MSANRAPHLSQLVRAVTPNPVEAEKATLKARFATASAALVAEAKCLLDDKPELWEEKVMWMCRWEEKTGEVYPIVKRGWELDIDVKIDAADGPVIAEANKAYERWSVEEVAAAAHVGGDEDVQMEEEVAQEAGEGLGTGATVPAVTERMSHVEVLQPACKQSRQMITESDNDGKHKVTVPPGQVLHAVPCAHCSVKGTPCFRPSGKTCDWCMKMKQGCEKSSKGAGKRAQAGASITRLTKAPKAGPSKWALDDDDDDDDVEVVETHAHSKGKAPVCGGLDGKTTSDISQALGMVRAEAVAAHAANLRLQVCIEQLLEALAKLGVE